MNARQSFIHTTDFNSNFSSETEWLEVVSDRELQTLSLDFKEQESKNLAMFLLFLDNNSFEEIYTIEKHSEGIGHWDRYVHYRKLTEMCEKEKKNRRLKKILLSWN